MASDSEVSGQRFTGLGLAFGLHGDFTVSSRQGDFLLPRDKLPQPSHLLFSSKSNEVGGYLLLGLAHHRADEAGKAEDPC